MRPAEINHMRAFMAFLQCDTIEEVAEATGLPVSTVQYLSNEYDWQKRRAEHFAKVQQCINEDLDNFAMKQARLASKLVDKLSELLEIDIDGIQVKSLSDLFEAFDTGVETIQKLIRAKPADRDTIQNTININFESKAEEDAFIDIMNEAYEDL